MGIKDFLRRMTAAPKTKNETAPLTQAASPKPEPKKLPYSGHKSRVRHPRPVKYLHISAPIVTVPIYDKNDKLIGVERRVQKPGKTYRRPKELQ